MRVKCEALRVLVVDDMPAVRAIVREMLQGLGFRQIDEAEDGEAAWRLVKQSVTRPVLRYDLLISPTMPVAAFEAGREAPAGYGDDWLEWSPYTYPFNLTGQPAVSVPAGVMTEGQVPAGLQIVGPRHRDDLVLQAAYAFEQARPWNDHWPVQVPAYV